MKQVTKMPKNSEVFAFLEELRKSSKTNMLESAPFVMDEFRITYGEAMGYIQKWVAMYVNDPPKKQMWAAGQIPGYGCGG